MSKRLKRFREPKLNIIKPGSLLVSPEGKIYDAESDLVHDPIYLSNTGYWFDPIITVDGKRTLISVDWLVVSAFMKAPEHLKGKDIKIIHKNGVNSDCNLSNLEMVEDVEEWKWVTYPNVVPGMYKISSHGRIIGFFDDDNPRELYPNKIKKYYAVSLKSLKYEHKSYKAYTIHRLVAHEFVSGFREDLVVNHIDGDTSNNHYLNLEWCTISQNTKHAMLMGTLTGSNRTMTEDEAKLVCLTLNKYKGDAAKTLAELKDQIPSLSRMALYSIRVGFSFVTIAKKYLTDEGRMKKFNHAEEDAVIEIAKSLKKHKGKISDVVNELKDKYPWINYGRVYMIKVKKNCADITDGIFSKDEFS